MRHMYSHPGEYRKILLVNYLCIGVVPGGILGSQDCHRPTFVMFKGCWCPDTTKKHLGVFRPVFLVDLLFPKRHEMLNRLFATSKVLNENDPIGRPPLKMHCLVFAV